MRYTGSMHRNSISHNPDSTTRKFPATHTFVFCLAQQCPKIVAHFESYLKAICLAQQCPKIVAHFESYLKAICLAQQCPKIVAHFERCLKEIERHEHVALPTISRPRTFQEH